MQGNVIACAPADLSETEKSRRPTGRLTLAMIGPDANELAGRLHHHTPVTLHRQDDEGRALLDPRDLLQPLASQEQEALSRSLARRPLGHASLRPDCSIRHLRYDTAIPIGI
jgi:hypothetical protein